MHREQVTGRRSAHGPGAKRRIFLRRRFKTEAGKDCQKNRSNNGSRYEFHRREPFRRITLVTYASETLFVSEEGTKSTHCRGWDLDFLHSHILISTGASGRTGLSGGRRVGKGD